MTTARTVGTIESPATEVWKYVGNFAGIDQFFPPLARSIGTGSGVGMQRKCVFRDGAELTETLLALDNDKRTLKYKVHDPNGFPFENYVSVMSVKDLGAGRCELEWSAEFDAQGMPPADVTNLLQGLYQQGIDSLNSLTAKAKRS